MTVPSSLVVMVPEDGRKGVQGSQDFFLLDEIKRYVDGVSQSSPGGTEEGMAMTAAANDT